MKKPFFVTGTDTDAGKTWVSLAILHAANAAGLRTLALKPVAAGAQRQGDDWVNQDALDLQAQASVRVPYAQVNPVLLKEPIAPHIAAQHENKSLSVARLAGLCRGAAMQPHDLLLIEGAGGWRVPLNPRETLADLARELDAQVILVVGMRIGCINHALLTAEAIRHDGLRLAGWVANQRHSTPMLCLQENIDSLRQRLGAPFLGAVSWNPSLDLAKSAAELDLSPILGAKPIRFG
jgi:dethiobiotin synthetase